MRAQERADLPDRQRNALLGLLPREHAHLGLWRQHRRFHGDGVGMGRNVVGQNQHRVWQVRTKSRVTVKTKSGLVRYIRVRNLSTVSIVMSGRLATSCG